MMAASSSSTQVAAAIRKLLRPLEDERADAARLDELRRLLSQHHTDLWPSSSSPAQTKWRDFLLASRTTMMEQLTDRIAEGRRTSVRTMFGLVAACPLASHNGSFTMIDPHLVQAWLSALVHLPVVDQAVRHMMEGEFLQPYRDVQYAAMLAIAQLANTWHQRGDTNPDETRRLLDWLVMIPVVESQHELEQGSYLFPPQGEAPEEGDDEESSDESDDDDDDDDDQDNDEGESSDEEEDERPTKRHKKETTRKKRLFAFQRISAHRRVWSKAWLAILRLDLPTDALKRALLFLPHSVLNRVSNPLLFADFFMTAYNNTGVVPLMALEGLFTLMVDHGLEYRDFYKQLYRLVTPSLLHVKYRTRFFRLLDRCLSRNEMLPAHVTAAFCKRLVGCCMSAPPSSILFCLALVSNLLRKHPEASCLVQRQETQLKDGFNPETNDPEAANALQSSLWELSVLERHYYPSVATLAKSIGREAELKTPLHNLDDFIGHTYKVLFEQERKRRGKKATALTFVEPTSLFTAQDIFSKILTTSVANQD